MITFKAFLLEGGAATAKYGVERANKSDIEQVLKLVGDTLGLSDIQDRVLGSTRLTLAGQKDDSGDVDIVLTHDDIDIEKADERMLSLSNNEGAFNKGTKVGSYAVPVNGKKVQVDLMYVNSKDWAKFIYHSAEGEASKYPGAVRNFLLMAVTRHTHEAGKDVLVKKGGEVIARASRAIKLDAGLERLFKMARQKETGEFNKTMDKVEPTELSAQINKLAGREVKFSHDAEIIDVPDKAAQWMFGPEVKAADIMTAEQVIEQIKKLKNADEVIEDAKAALAKADLPIPSEL